MSIQIKQYTPTSHKVKAVVYGASGSGKTSFGGTAKNAIFASAEGGLLSIADKTPNYVEIRSLQDLRDLHMFLKTQKHNFETVIIDSITEINDIIKNEIEKKSGKGMQLQDWGTLSKEIKKTLRDFRDLDMHVLFIAQETADEKDEAGTASKIVPSLNGKAATEIAYFMDIVGYIYIVKATGEHKLITLPNARYLTKDRSKLIGNDTEADFSVWVEKIAQIKTGDQVITAEYSSEAPAQTTPANTAPANKPAAPAVAPKSPTLFFDTVKMRVDTLKTVEQLKAALVSVDTMTKLTDTQKQEIKEIITEKLELAEFEASQEAAPEVPATPDEGAQVETPTEPAKTKTKSKK